MKCEQAKRNDLVRRQAIRHYLHEGKREPFTFISLWSDSEPYPLMELLEVQQAHIEALKAEQIGEQPLLTSRIQSEELTLKHLKRLHKKE